MNTDKLINKILLSSNDDLIVFIDEYFICNEKVNDFSHIKEREKDLLKLDEDVLNYALFRLESLEETYDSSKGSTAGINLIGVISGFFLKDYVPIFIDSKLHPNLYIFCQLGIFMIVIYFLSKLLRSMDKKSGKKSKVIYFRKLLEYILKEKMK